MEYQFKTKQDFIAYLSSEVIDTSEASEILGCSRQNLSYHVTRGNLVPIKHLKKEMLFLKADILSLNERMSLRKKG